jgi:hypothetical protein
MAGNRSVIGARAMCCVYYSPNRFHFLMHLMLPIPAYQQCHFERKEGFSRLSLISCDTEVIHDLITPLSYYPQSSTPLALHLTYISYVS